MRVFQWLERLSSANQCPAVRRPGGPDSPPVRKRFRFFGNVQGVGFRYEARLTADLLDLTGWAGNESDGTVTVETQGQEACIREFLRVMRSVPRFRITEIRAEDLPVRETETGFRTLY